MTDLVKFGIKISIGSVQLDSLNSKTLLVFPSIWRLVRPAPAIQTSSFVDNPREAVARDLTDYAKVTKWTI